MSFRKHRAEAPDGFFACEAAGLAWLDVPGGPRVVRVVSVSTEALELERLQPAAPSREAAHAFGTALARLHDAGAPCFGAPPPAWGQDGFFGPLDQPLPLPRGNHQRWGEFYAQCRLDQVRDLLAAHGALSTRLAADLARVTTSVRAGAWDDDDAPARLHGDLWSGNVMWTADGAVLIDPAAHGGHRMTDLAMLELFGLPFLADVLAGYREVHRLPEAWDDDVGLHQLYPIGMHAVLFGGGYVRQFAQLVARYA